MARAQYSGEGVGGHRGTRVTMRLNKEPSKQERHNPTYTFKVLFWLLC